MQLQALLAWHQSWCGDFPYNETYPTAECANKAKERLKKLTEAQTNLIFFFFLSSDQCTMGMWAEIDLRVRVFFFSFFALVISTYW